MRARRAKLRRARFAAVSGAVVVAAAVAILAVGVSSTGGHRLNVTEPTTTTSAPVGTTTAPADRTTLPATVPPQHRFATRQIFYQPFTSTGAVDPSLHVTARVAGACITGEVGRSYRCFDSGAAAGVYDPCFSGPQGTTAPLVCPGNPATGDVTEFTSTSVTGPPTVTTKRLFAMQLAGGQVCVFVSAAWGGLGPYDCQFGDSSVTPADCRTPQSSAPWFTTECQADKTEASPFTTERVTKVWF